jgi:hypothetical protein
MSQVRSDITPRRMQFRVVLHELGLTPEYEEFKAAFKASGLFCYALITYYIHRTEFNYEGGILNN